MEDERQAIQQREQGKATVRALYLARLQDIKKRRAAALEEAESQLDRLAQILGPATDSGLTLSEISKAAGVSRPTLYQLRARYGNNYDLRLALLQSIANFGAARSEALTELFRVEAERVRPELKAMMDEGLIDEEFNNDPDDPAMELRLKLKGLDALESWDLDDLRPDEREEP